MPLSFLAQFSTYFSKLHTITSAYEKGGKILGHSHITIQEIKGNKRKPLNPKAFAFFKGLDDPAENGVLSVEVESGLPAGDYRICTIVSSFTHQPVVMPIAQRGAQDDCIRIKVRKWNKWNEKKQKNNLYENRIKEMGVIDICKLI